MRWHRIIYFQDILHYVGNGGRGGRVTHGMSPALQVTQSSRRGTSRHCTINVFNVYNVAHKPSQHNNCVSITISLTANSQKTFLGFLSFPVSYKLYISCVLTFLPFTSYLFFYWQWIWTKNGCEEMMMINNLEYMHLLVYIWLICHYCHQVHSTFSNYFVKLKHQHRGRPPK